MRVGIVEPQQRRAGSLVQPGMQHVITQLTNSDAWPIDELGFTSYMSARTFATVYMIFALLSVYTSYLAYPWCDSRATRCAPGRRCRRWNTFAPCHLSTPLVERYTTSHVLFCGLFERNSRNVWKVQDSPACIMHARSSRRIISGGHAAMMSTSLSQMNFHVYRALRMFCYGEGDEPWNVFTSTNRTRPDP
jgi:hypothetical protein